MIRGTTPTIEYTLPFAAANLATAWITLVQSDTVIADRAISECVLSGNKISCQLTQTETLRLKANIHAICQLRAVTTEGKAVATMIDNIAVSDVLKDGEI